jgi:hypothetical protein
MAITTQDGLVSALGAAQRLVHVKANVTAVAGRMTALWSAAGQPGVGSLTTGQAAAGAVPVDSDTGFPVFTNPGGGVTSYLAGVSGVSAASGLLVIWDCQWVWTSGGSGWVVTTTTAQNTTAPAALTRPDSTGANNEAWLHVLATLGAGAATPQLSYTDQSGNAGATAGPLASTSGFIVGSMVQFPLAADDYGVRSVQSLTLTTTMTSGQACIRLMKRVASIPINANIGFKYDAYDLGLPVISNDAALFVGVQSSSTTSGPTQVELILAQG